MKYAKRGQMYYVRKGKDYMHDRGQGRPAIIVSDARINESTDRVMVIYMTRTDSGRPAHILVNVCGTPSYAICDNINTIFKDRLENYIGEVTPEEMQNIDKALIKSLDLDKDPVCDECDVNIDYEIMEKKLEMEIQEKNFYKRMYDELLGKVMNH